MPWFIRMLLYLSPVVLLVQLYIAWRFQNAWLKAFYHSPVIVKSVSFGLIAYLNIFPLIVLLSALFGQLNDLFLFENQLHWEDYFFLFPYWWGLVTAIAILPYYLVLDAGQLLLSLKSLPRLRYVGNIFFYLKIFVVFFFMIYTAFRLHYDTYHVQSDEHHLSFPQLPEKFNGLTVTLIGDIQIDRYTGTTKTRELKARIEEISSDILLFSGDLVTSGNHFIPEGLDVICSLNATDQKIACMGDHDFWANPERIRQGLQECGWIFLQNEHYILKQGEDSLLITGISHLYSQRISPEKLENILANAPAADFKILLVHQPAPFIIKAAARHGYQLVCAGHTHGGQLKFRPFGLIFALSMFETPYFSGLYEEGNTFVLVTNGIGLTFAPIRYQAAAQISTVILQSR